MNKIPHCCFDSLILFPANYNLTDIVKVWLFSVIYIDVKSRLEGSRLILHSALIISKSESSTGERDILVAPALRVGSIAHPSGFSLNWVILLCSQYSVAIYRYGSPSIINFLAVWRKPLCNIES